MTGSNFSTECCREPEWGGYAGIDRKLALDIHKKFGNFKLKIFQLLTFLPIKFIINTYME